MENESRQRALSQEKCCKFEAFHLLVLPSVHAGKSLNENFPTSLDMEGGSYVNDVFIFNFLKRRCCQIQRRSRVFVAGGV